MQCFAYEPYRHNYYYYFLLFTERSGRVLGTSASSLGGPGFKPRSGDRIVLTEVFGGFPQSLQGDVGMVLKLGDVRFLLYPLENVHSFDAV
jgi:hypothetical protein